MTAQVAPSTGSELLGLLSANRAVPDRNGTAPDNDQLAAILKVASTVPDHGALRPWRFAVVRGEGRQRFGDALVAGLVGERGAELPDSVITKMRQKAFAAPALVMLIASPQVGSNVPVWEQVAAASCTGYAVVLAATGLGLGAIWKSAPVLHTEPVRRLFGAQPDEQLLGWVNLGSPSERTSDRRETVPAAPVVVIDDRGEHPLEA